MKSILLRYASGIAIGGLLVAALLKQEPPVYQIREVHRTSVQQQELIRKLWAIINACSRKEGGAYVIGDDFWMCKSDPVPIKLVGDNHKSH